MRNSLQKRIYINFLCLLLPAVLLLSALLSWFFYTVSKNREMDSVREGASLIAELLNRGVEGEVTDYTVSGALRVTIVGADGTVLLDNRVDADSMENHGDRAEVIDAFRTGEGEAIRRSGTLSDEMFYRAVLLDNGTALRLSKPIRSMAGVFTASLPTVLLVTFLVLFLAYILARRLTRNIVKPLSEIGFEAESAEIYEELLPYTGKIKEQRREIAGTIAALKDRADTIETITENMREGLILLDKSGTVLTANKTVSDLFGDAEKILHICRDIEFQQGVKRCLSGENAEILFERGGKTYGVVFSPVSGGELGAVILFIDMTERYEAERQRREFSANVSHELKTPLTSISALSEMIETGIAKDADIRAFAARISDQASRLINMIDDIIKLSELDEGRGVAERETFDLYGLAESVADVLRDNAKGVTVTLSGERFAMSANRRMIGELLTNLIGNGVKYNKEGGGVSVTLSRENGLCKIAVSDTGIGIPAEDRSRVFERFYRVDPSRSKKTGGTGLGLSIVKHIAEYHGGRVELESALGVGTTVVCRIPG
ncbi:MAG: hypothetical protein LBR76_03065 [Oscillospiraceae bacterium]|nr:hypothetical protein [Oscillospiraceae bacterium]